MTDLIDKQIEIDALDKHCDNVCQYSKKQRSVMCGACPLGTAFDVIEQQPAIDAVEVVRCKDCEYYTEEERWCRRLGLCGAFDQNGYCSHAERRTDE